MDLSAYRVYYRPARLLRKLCAIINLHSSSAIYAKLKKLFNSVMKFSTFRASLWPWKCVGDGFATLNGTFDGDGIDVIGVVSGSVVDVGYRLVRIFPTVWR